MVCNFTFGHYREIIQNALDSGYEIINCLDYSDSIKNLPDKYLILRHDIEHYPDRALELAKIESELGVKSTFFVRVHAKKYNIFSYPAYNNLMQIKDMGHEMGLHAEPVDFHKINRENIGSIFRKEIEVLNLVLESEILGVSPHVNWDEYNNQDFFDENNVSDFGLKYWAYQDNFFKENFYISDGQATYWKNYDNGVLLKEKDCICKVIDRGIKNLYCLIHPMRWFGSGHLQIWGEAHS